jgi:16S rRNA (guanine527-N7)-methyltransferase
MCRYLSLVRTWNARHDLTAARDDDEFVDLFVADAVVLATHAHAEEHWVDVGSGAGAPGLPLGLLRPDLSITLVEPRAKRVAFLRSALGSLGATMSVKRSRGEDLEESAFEVAVSRATLSPPDWSALGVRLARASVWVLLAQAEPPAQPGWRADLDVRYRWPLTGAERRAVRLVRDDRTQAFPEV